MKTLMKVEFPVVFERVGKLIEVRENAQCTESCWNIGRRGIIMGVKVKSL
jgi:hypothetical protein